MPEMTFIPSITSTVFGVINPEYVPPGENGPIIYGEGISPKSTAVLVGAGVLIAALIIWRIK